MPFESKTLRVNLNPIAHINIKFSEEESKIIDALRLELQMTRTDFIRFCIKDYLENK